MAHPGRTRSSSPPTSRLSASSGGFTRPGCGAQKTWRSSYDGTIEASYTWPALTVVRQPVQQMAEADVAIVLDGSATDSSYQQFATDLVVRQSCGCPPAG